MKSTKRTRKPPAFSVHAIALASGLDKDTVSRRLAASNATPDRGGRYSLAQVINALTGGLHAERLRKLQAETRLAELEAARQQGSLTSRAEVDRLWEDAAVAVRTRMMDLRRRMADQYPLWRDRRDCYVALDEGIRDALSSFKDDPDFLRGPAPLSPEEDPASRLLEPLLPSQPQPKTEEETP